MAIVSAGASTGGSFPSGHGYTLTYVAGNFVFVSLQLYYASSTGPPTGLSVTDNKGNTYSTPVFSTTYWLQSGAWFIYNGYCYAKNVNSGSTTVTATFTGLQCVVGVNQFSGIPSSTVIDGSSDSTGSITTTQDQDCIFINQVSSTPPGFHGTAFGSVVWGQQYQAGTYTISDPKYYAVAFTTPPLKKQITVFPSIAGNEVGGTFLEFSNTGSSIVVTDGTSGNNGSSTSISAGSFTTTQNNDIVVASVFGSSGSTYSFTAGSPFTLGSELQNVSGGGNLIGDIYYVQPTAAAVNATANFNQNFQTNSIVATAFKNSGSSNFVQKASYASQVWIDYPTSATISPASLVTANNLLVVSVYSTDFTGTPTVRDNFGGYSWSLIATAPPTTKLWTFAAIAVVPSLNNNSLMMMGMGT